MARKEELLARVKADYTAWYELWKKQNSSILNQ